MSNIYHSIVVKCRMENAQTALLKMGKTTQEQSLELPNKIIIAVIFIVIANIL